jgi:hypothetical protein
VTAGAATLIFIEFGAPKAHGKTLPSKFSRDCGRYPYLRYPLNYRNLEEMVAERGLSVDHSTIARWALVQSRGQQKSDN